MQGQHIFRLILKEYLSLFPKGIWLDSYCVRRIYLVTRQGGEQNRIDLVHANLD